MDAPSPISIETNENKGYEKNNITIKKKEYKLEMNNNKYNLIIFIDNKYINFKLTQINDIIFNYYINKYDLNSINNTIDLTFKKYNNLEKVMKLINDCYNNNKLLIKKDDEMNNEINIIMKYPIGYDECECSIRLMKKELDINEKFEIILNEMILMKKDKNIEVNENFKKVEKLILEIKDNINKKLEEDLKVINELKKKIERNRINIENNHKIINILKNEIFNINNWQLK